MAIEALFQATLLKGKLVSVVIENMLTANTIGKAVLI